MAEKLPVCVLTILVNDGDFITKSQSPSEDRADVVAAGCPCGLHTSVGTDSPLLHTQPPAVQVTQEVSCRPAHAGGKQGEQHPASRASFGVILQKAIIGTDKYEQRLPRGLFPQRKSGSFHLSNTHCIINVYGSGCCIASVLGPDR